MGTVARRRILLLLVISVVTVGTYVVRWTAMDHSQILRSDFISIDTAGTMWHEGSGNHLYQAGAQAPVYAGLVAGDHSGDLLYEQAPLTSAIAAPVSSLEKFVAYRIWSAAQFLLLLIAVVIAARASPWRDGTSASVRVAAVAAALAGTATLTMTLEGQSLGLHALGLSLFYALWRSQKRGWAGWVLGFSVCLAKPHLFVGVAAWLLGRCDRRSLIGAATGVAVAGVLSLVLVGPGAIAGFAGNLATTNSLWPLHLLYGFTGLFTGWFGAGWTGQGIALVFELSAYALAWRLGRYARQGSLEVSLALALVLSLVASPHLYSHDLALLAPAFVWMFAWCTARDGDKGAKNWPGRNSGRLIAYWLILNTAVAVDYGVQGLPAILGRLTPIVLAVAAYPAWNLVRRRGEVSSLQ
jgi:hypothetical protein